MTDVTGSKIFYRFSGRIPHTEVYRLMCDMSPPVGFGRKCPKFIAYKVFHMLWVLFNMLWKLSNNEQWFHVYLRHLLKFRQTFVLLISYFKVLSRWKKIDFREYRQNLIDRTEPLFIHVYLCIFVRSLCDCFKFILSPTPSVLPPVNVVYNNALRCIVCLCCSFCSIFSVVVMTPQHSSNTMTGMNVSIPFTALDKDEHANNGRQHGLIYFHLVRTYQNSSWDI